MTKQKESKESKDLEAFLGNPHADADEISRATQEFLKENKKKDKKKDNGNSQGWDQVVDQVKARQNSKKSAPSDADYMKLEETAKENSLLEQQIADVRRDIENNEVAHQKLVQEIKKGAGSYAKATLAMDASPKNEVKAEKEFHLVLSFEDKAVSARQIEDFIAMDKNLEVVRKGEDIEITTSSESTLKINDQGVFIDSDLSKLSASDLKETAEAMAKASKIAQGAGAAIEVRLCGASDTKEVYEAMRDACKNEGLKPKPTAKYEDTKQESKENGSQLEKAPEKQEDSAKSTAPTPKGP